MAVVTSRALVEALIEADGRLPGGVPVVRIVEFENDEGETLYRVGYSMGEQVEAGGGDLLLFDAKSGVKRLPTASGAGNAEDQIREAMRPGGRPFQAYIETGMRALPGEAAELSAEILLNLEERLVAVEDELEALTT
jgi:hypothetical protein